MNGERTYRLASYNVRKCIGLDRRRRPGRTIDVINDIGADIIVLQEADKRLGDRHAALPARMVEAASDYSVVPVAENDVSLGWHGNAVLVKRGIAVDDVRRIDLPGTEPRGAVSFTVDQSTTVVAAHLGLLRSDRRRQLGEILLQLNGSVSRSVVMGDFNEWRPRQGLEPLLAAMDVHSPGRSYHAAQPLAALDRIALGHGIALRDAGVLETRLSRVTSDHLPIWAEIGAA